MARPDPRVEGLEGPIRSCIVRRERSSRDDLVRLVLSPEGRVVVDWRGRLPGRGAWLTPEREVVETLVKKPGALFRALGVEKADLEGLLAQMQAQSLEAALEALGLCARAGSLAHGKDGVRAALSSGAGIAAIIADDASERATEDLGARAGELPLFPLPLPMEELGRRIGKGPRSVVLILNSKPGRNLLPLLRRFARLR